MHYPLSATKSGWTVPLREQILQNLCGNMVGDMPSGLLGFSISWLHILAGLILCPATSGGTARNEPNGTPLLFWHFPPDLHYSVSIANKVSDTLRVFPKETPVLFNA
jgi:hypothetical protein